MSKSSGDELLHYLYISEDLGSRRCWSGSPRPPKRPKGATVALFPIFGFRFSVFESGSYCLIFGFPASYLLTVRLVRAGVVLIG